MFDLQTVELVVEGSEPVLVESRPMLRGGDFDSSDTLVLVEALDGDEPLTVTVNGFDPQRQNTVGLRSAFLAIGLSNGALPGVRIAAAGARRLVRVTFARVRRLAQWGWSNLSCPLCKWAIKVLITGGLTLAGVPIPADSDILSELLDNLGDVIETFADTEYADVWDTIRDVLDWAQDALDALDRFLAEVCRRLGACP